MSRCLWVSCYFVELRSEAPSEQSASPYASSLASYLCPYCPSSPRCSSLVRDHSCEFFSHSQIV